MAFQIKRRLREAQFIRTRREIFRTDAPLGRGVFSSADGRIWTRVLDRSLRAFLRSPSAQGSPLRRTSLWFLTVTFVLRAGNREWPGNARAAAPKRDSRKEGKMLLLDSQLSCIMTGPFDPDEVRFNREYRDELGKNLPIPRMFVDTVDARFLVEPWIQGGVSVSSTNTATQVACLNLVRKALFLIAIRDVERFRPEGTLSEEGQKDLLSGVQTSVGRDFSWPTVTSHRDLSVDNILERDGAFHIIDNFTLGHAPLGFDLYVFLGGLTFLTDQDRASILKGFIVDFFSAVSPVLPSLTGTDCDIVNFGLEINRLYYNEMWSDRNFGPSSSW